jgi:transposase
LACRILELTGEIDDLNQQLARAAALLITAGDNPERLGSEASYAALCGASPVQVSSGKTRREALRCLKRYIAREIYQIITQPRPHPTAACHP